MRIDRLRTGPLWGQARVWQLPGMVKSIQYGVLTAANTVATATAAITAVDMSNALVTHLGASGSNFAGSNRMLITIASTVAVSGTRSNTTLTDAITCPFCVTEYYPGFFHSIQRDTVTIAAGATTGTKAIAAVNPAMSVLSHLGENAFDSTEHARLALTSTVLVTATIQNVLAHPFDVGFQVAYHV